MFFLCSDPKPEGWTRRQSVFCQLTRMLRRRTRSTWSFKTMRWCTSGIRGCERRDSAWREVHQSYGTSVSFNPYHLTLSSCLDKIVGSAVEELPHLPILFSAFNSPPRNSLRSRQPVRKPSAPPPIASLRMPTASLLSDMPSRTASTQLSTETFWTKQQPNLWLRLEYF